MKLTALTCMYDKPPYVMELVLRELNQADEVIVVLDRPDDERKAKAALHSPDMVLSLEGPSGWRSPCISWNAGLRHVTGDWTLVIQGDVVLDPGSIAFIKQAIEHDTAAYFGKVLESDPAICKGPGHAGPVLVSSQNPRPLTYLMAVPTAALRDIHGWDLDYQAGVWYEDDDLTTRLWKHGLDFIFDDRFSAVHQSHGRTYSKPLQIATNQQLYLQKHGTLSFHTQQHAQGKMKRTEQPPHRLFWTHVEDQPSAA